MSASSAPRREVSLRYGLNPHQTPARAYVASGSLPFAVRNGAPSFVNLLDALNSWQLVRELRRALGLPAAASFKHVSPAGVAVALPLSEPLRRASRVQDLELSPLAAAYARARGADRLSSFGDWVALSERVDRPTAELLRREVSDGIVAPGYEDEALELLRAKHQGRYVIIEVDASYEPPADERREVFGVTLEQPRNTYVPSPASLGDVVTKRRDLPETARRDITVALITLKYTQSNSICLALDGQVIGVGAGQQSRIDCTRLAAEKADLWWLRQHPKVLGLRFVRGAGRPVRDNAVDLYLRDERATAEERLLEETLVGAPAPLTAAEKREWLARLRDVVLGSDGFLPFRDSIDCAARSGVRYVVQPGGSARDAEVTAACDEYGMVMVLSGVRLFHH